MTPEVAAFLRRERVGVFATVTAAGRPRQSLVYYALDGDRVLVSTLAGRLKARDVERTGWASLAVRGDESPFPSATVAGPAEVLTADIAGFTALVAQSAMGASEPPAPQTEAALAEAGRVVIAIAIEQVGPTTYL